MQQEKVIESSTTEEIPERRVFGRHPAETSLAPDDAVEGDTSPAETESVPSNDVVPQGDGLTYRGEPVTGERVQELLNQHAHLDQLRGRQGSELGELRKLSQQQAEQIAELRGRIDASSGNQQQEQTDFGQEWQDMVLTNPEQAVETLVNMAVERAEKRISGQVDEKVTGLQSKVEAQGVVDAFYQTHPDVRQYDSVQIGGRSLVQIARDELVGRAASDPVLQSQISNSQQQAFKALADETVKLAKKFGYAKPENSSKTEESPTISSNNQVVTERGGTFRGGRSTTEKEGSSQPLELFKSAQKILQSNRNRIRPANANYAGLNDE